MDYSPWGHRVGHDLTEPQTRPSYLWNLLPSIGCNGWDGEPVTHSSATGTVPREWEPEPRVLGQTHPEQTGPLWMDVLGLVTPEPPPTCVSKEPTTSASETFTLRHTCPIPSSGVDSRLEAQTPGMKWLRSERVRLPRGRSCLCCLPVIGLCVLLNSVGHRTPSPMPLPLLLGGHSSTVWHTHAWCLILPVAHGHQP